MDNGTPRKDTQKPAEKTVEQVVNELVVTVVAEDGKIDWNKVPEGVKVTDELKVAVTAEKRRRDTQSGFTKKAQALAELEEQNKILAKKLAEQASQTLNIPEDVQTELDDLKWKDPDAYAEKIIALRDEAKEKHTKQLADELAGASNKAKAQTEMMRREQILEDFNASNPDSPLTLEILDTAVPRAIADRLDKGEIGFEDAIKEAHNFIYGEKQVEAGATVPNQPSLNTVGSAGGINVPLQGNASDNDILW